MLENIDSPKSRIYPKFNDRMRLKKFDNYVFVYDTKASINDIIHPSQAVFLALCTGEYSLKDLEYLIKEIYGLTIEKTEEMIDVYTIQSQPFLDYFTDPCKTVFQRYEVTQFFYNPSEEVFKQAKSQPIPIPIAINLNLTFNCNFNCRYCYQSRALTVKGKLDFGKCLDIIREAAKWGVTYVGLSGGEPTLFDGWMALLEEIIKLGMNPIITTNGVIIGGKPDIANHLKMIGLKEITVSLDASTPELHHYITRSNNSFMKVLNAITWLVDSGIKVSAKSVLTPYNKDDIGNLIDLLVKIGVSEIGISNCEAGASGSEANLIPRLSANEENIVREIVNKKRQQYIGICNISPPSNRTCLWNSNDWYPCGGLFSGMSIHPNGKVSVCDKLGENTPFIYGDVFTHTLKEIWEGNDLKKLRNIAVDKKFVDQDCFNCSKINYCRTSCFVDSFQVTGNYFAKHPLCSGPY